MSAKESEADSVKLRPIPGPGIYRWENGKFVKKPSKLVIDARPKTKAGTVVKVQGRPRKETGVGGVHLILYPWFTSWLEKSPKRAEQWNVIADKRRYFLRLAVSAVLPEDSKNLRAPLAYCYRIAPDLTCAALLRLRKRALKINQDDANAAAAGSSPSYGTFAQPRKITPREADRRKKARKALADFRADTRLQTPGDKAI
jgi:hypothetical protein